MYHPFFRDERKEGDEEDVLQPLHLPFRLLTTSFSNSQ
jgi:hypothetical protein